MFNSQLKATGELTITVRDKNGAVKQEVTVPNLVVTDGKEFICSRMVGTTEPVMSHMAIGTDSSNLIAANDALGAEVARVALSSSTTTGSVVSYSATFPATVPSGGAAVVEAGIFNASSAGVMLCRTTFSAINKADEDSLSINWNITIN